MWWKCIIDCCRNKDMGNGFLGQFMKEGQRYSSLFFVRSFIGFKVAFRVLFRYGGLGDFFERRKGSRRRDSVLGLVLSREEELVGVRIVWRRVVRYFRVFVQKKRDYYNKIVRRYWERMFQKVQRREWFCESCKFLKGKVV